MSDSAIMSVDRVALLRFFDDSPREENARHATAVNAVAGEELGLALLLHYLSGVGVKASCLDFPCTTGGKRGHRLDAWVRTPKLLYQVEVKNWSSLSLGGRRFPLGASPEESREHRLKVWSEYWDGSTFVERPAAKVLEPMKPPTDDMPVEPLIAFWVSLHPNGDAEPLFRMPLTGKAFDNVNVFSMSTYLRTLNTENLELPLPKTLARLAILHQILGSKSGAALEGENRCQSYTLHKMKKHVQKK